MNQKNLEVVEMSLKEYENFRILAQQSNVLFDAKQKCHDVIIVKAPRDKILEWGYDENEEFIEPGN